MQAESRFCTGDDIIFLGWHVIKKSATPELFTPTGGQCPCQESTIKRIKNAESGTVITIETLIECTISSHTSSSYIADSAL